MKPIEVKEFIKAVEARGTHLMGGFSGVTLSVQTRALAEATVYFLNKIISENDNSNKLKE